MGMLLRVEVTAKLALQQEYTYSQLSGAVDGGASYKLRYLSLPVLLKYQLLPRVALTTGPQFDLLLSADETLSGATTDITHDTEERGVGVIAGVEARIWRSCSLSARYLQGLNHIGIGQRTAVQEFKWQVVQLATEVRF